MGKGTMDKTAKFWKIQKDFNKNFIKNFKNKEEHSKEMILHLISECDEFLREINWKVHREEDIKVIKSNLLEEWIDIYKYWLSLGLIWNFTPKDFETEFIRKSEVVEQRYKQEKKLNLNSGKICAIDIDGVLAKYPESFLKFAKKEFGVSWNINNVPDCFQRPSKLHNKIKDAYRQSGEKRNLEVIDGAKEMLKHFKKLGYTIILLTARPYKKYKRIFADTLEWLDKNDLIYDAIIWDENKNERVIKEFPKMKFMVEDSESNAVKIAELGYKVFVVDTPYPQKRHQHKNIIRVKNLEEIQDES